MIKKINQLLSAFIICSTLLCQTIFAVEPLPKNLIDFTSQSGMALLQDSMNLNTLKLLSHFNTQKTPTYCGVASAVMVLNSLSTILPPLDEDHPPYTYFTQTNFFNDKVKQVLDIKDVEKNGIPLAKLDLALKMLDLKTQVYFADKINFDQFRDILKTALNNNQYVIVNFLRTGLHQQGGGHHSPVAAYNKKTDQFLILDVAQYKYIAFWANAMDLWNAVNTKDGDTYRGLIVIEDTH